MLGERNWSYDCFDKISRMKRLEGVEMKEKEKTVTAEIELNFSLSYCENMDLNFACALLMMAPIIIIG